MLVSYSALALLASFLLTEVKGLVVPFEGSPESMQLLHTAVTIDPLSRMPFTKAFQRFQTSTTVVTETTVKTETRVIIKTSFETLTTKNGHQTTTRDINTKPSTIKTPTREKNSPASHLTGSLYSQTVATHRPSIAASYPAFSRSNSTSSLDASRTTSIAIAVVVPVALVFLFIAAFLVYRRKRYQAPYLKQFSHTHDYSPPNDGQDMSYKGISMLSSDDGTYDEYTSRAILGADTSKLWPLTLPQTASHQPPSVSETDMSSLPPPSPPPKDNVEEYTVQKSNPRTPFRAAWRRALVAPKRSRVFRGSNNDGYPNITHLYHAPQPEPNLLVIPTPSTQSRSTYSSTSYQHADFTSAATFKQGEAADEGEAAEETKTPQSDDEAFTHPLFRQGSFETRVAPKTPKTPRSLGFDFNFTSTTRTPARPKSRYELPVPQLGDENLGLDDFALDIESPYQPPADLYNRLANPTPQIDLTDENGCTNQVYAQDQDTPDSNTTLTNGTPPATLFPEADSRTGSSSLYTTLSPSPSTDNRPASSVYSEYAPASPSASIATRRGGRVAERGLWIRTTHLATTEPPPPVPIAMEYEDMLAWPAPLSVASSGSVDSSRGGRLKFRYA